MWKNYKHGKAVFIGSYERDKDGERVFVLTHGKRKITFESWQAAKALGWKNAFSREESK